MMKIKLIFLLLLLDITLVYSQQRQHIDIRPKALDVGVYDATKVVKNTYKVFYDQAAERAFFELVEKNEALRKMWMYEVVDDDGNISYSTESEILAYYPDLKIVITTGGHGFVNVDDIFMEKSLCGDPMTYTYSPSGKYRISGIMDDGMRYFLEEKINGEYECLDLVFYAEPVSGFYWHDDETIYYLRERTRYTEEEEIKYKVGYSTKFYPIKR